MREAYERLIRQLENEETNENERSGPSDPMRSSLVHEYDSPLVADLRIRARSIVHRTS